MSVVSASRNEENTVKLTYQSLVIRMKKECSCNDWQDGVLQYYVGCSQSAKEYPAPYNQSDNVMNTFEIFLNKLLDLTASNSTILSTSSTAILEAMSMLSKMGGTPGNLLNECLKTLPKLSDDLRTVVSRLSVNVGQLTTRLINKAITDLQHSIMHFGTMFQDSGVEHFGNGLAKNADYKPVAKHAQVLMNMIALIAETTLNSCDITSTKIFDSLTILTLISNWYLIGAHSINVVAQGVLQLTSQLIPDNLYASLLTIGPILQPMADAIGAINIALIESQVEVLTSLVNITVYLNSKLDDLLGCFEGVDTTVGEITYSLLTTVNKTHTAV